MEFEELQKIWDAQNNQPLYVINEQALHNRVVAKKRQVTHIAGFTEWLLMVVNVTTGVFLLQVNFTKHNYVFVYLLAVWLFGSALYVLVSRLHRMREQHKFNRTLLGDLQHALATASYQVRIAHIMRWNVLPVAILVLLIIWEGRKSLWVALIVALVFMVTFYASRWELLIYKRKKQELETLQQKLLEEESPLP